MAIIKNILQGLSGKIGPLSGAQYGDKTVLRSLPRKRTKPYSQAELDTRLKFKTEQLYLGRLLPFIRIGYRQHTGYASAFNACKSNARRTALQGAFPHYYINPQLLLLSCGTLPLPAGMACSLSGGTITVSWQQTANYACNADKAVMLLAHDTVTDRVYFKAAAAITASGSAQLQVKAGQQYNVWAAVYEINGLAVSNSCYFMV